MAAPSSRAQARSKPMRRGAPESTGEYGRLVESLKIDGARVPVLAQALHAFDRAQHRAAIERNHFVDRGTSLQHGRPFPFDDPIDSARPDAPPATPRRREPCAGCRPARSAARPGNVPRVHSLRLGAPPPLRRMRRTASVRFSASASGCLGHVVAMQFVFPAAVSGHHQDSARPGRVGHFEVRVTVANDPGGRQDPAHVRAPRARASRDSVCGIRRRLPSCAGRNRSRRSTRRPRQAPQPFSCGLRAPAIPEKYFARCRIGSSRR